jgi:hypothetical protein
MQRCLKKSEAGSVLARMPLLFHSIMLYACNKRGDQNARKVFAGLVGNFVRGIAWSDAVSDFYADRIACFGLRDIGVFYLH